MRFQKIISVILHPIVIPTVGVILYFLSIPNQIDRFQQYTIIGFIFISTYLIPLLILVLLKAFKLITSFKVHSIKERKFPLFLMIIIFHFMGSILTKNSALSELGTLFFATSYALIIVFILFIMLFKISLHMLSIGAILGFFLVLGLKYTTFFLFVVLFLILVAGLLGSARLHLKAHNSKEVYFGFFLGVISQLVTFYLETI